MQPSIIQIFIVSICTTLFSGCGGGGGGGGENQGPVTSTDTFQLRAAYINYITESRSLPFTLSGTESGITFTGSGTVTLGNSSNATFEGQSAISKSTTSTFTVTANGTTVSDGGTSTSYFTSNYVPLGFTGSEYEVVTATSIPTTAKVNDTGTMFTSDLYTNSSKASKIGTSTTTFVLEPDTASTALLKIINVDRSTSNTVTSTEVTTFRITPMGALTRLTDSVVDDTLSMTFRY
jgi:hypothetical protein